MSSEAADLNIKAVSTLTGVNESTLRAWERRYGAVEPKRTPSGRRRYSFPDVERLRLLVRLTEGGQAIGDIAALDDRDLAKRLARLESSARHASGGAPSATTARGEDDDVSAIAAALRSFDLGKVHDLVDRARFRTDPRRFVLETVAPLMVGTGHFVATGDISIAQEHALSAVVKAHLLEMIFTASRTRSPARGRVALATMEGDLHEIGLLIAGVLCAFYGLNTLYLGASMPARPLAAAMTALNADTLLLGTTKLPPGILRHSVGTYLQEVGSGLSRKHQIWLGGAAHGSVDAAGLRPRLLCLPTFADLDHHLSGVR